MKELTRIRICLSVGIFIAVLNTVLYIINNTLIGLICMLICLLLLPLHIILYIKNSRIIKIIELQNSINKKASNIYNDCLKMVGKYN